ncbi:activating signal cointegrator 1 complex subunit 2 isoform X2 [Belonocnema kinseyi]|nr:activating signal cointegrator 1 complex subunit 2 isoform X2 [Belonocnema kinseyi]
MEMLISFLQEAPPYYAIDDFPSNPQVRDQLNNLRRYVLMIFARLVTNKESPSEHMSRSFHGNLLYNNYIFTVPIILDLCQQYGRENKRTVDKILKSLFTLQPLYMEDFKRAVSFLEQVFSTVEKRFEDCPTTFGEAMLLMEKDSCDISLPALEDLIVHLLDTSSNLAVFLENYPPATELFQAENFITKVVSVYANTIPEMYKRLNYFALQDETMPKYIELRYRLDVSRVEILKLYRTIVYKNIGDILDKRNTASETDVKNQAENYLNLISHAIAEKEFITDYHRFYPVDDDMEILSQVCPEVDSIKRDFILQSIYAMIIKDKVVTGGYKEAVVGTSGVRTNIPLLENEVSSAGEPPKCKKPTEEELIRLMSEVKEILCHLGEGFIERCLKHYNYDSAMVINAVLEDTLPPNLKEVDISLPHIPPDPEEASAEVDLAIGGQRLNVFDNDEFDIMTNDKIDRTKVHKGKRKSKYKNINEMLNDKSETKGVEHIYSKYNLVSYEYDDEYDDTYDSHDIGESAQDDALEMDRPFTTPRVLLRKEKVEEAFEEEEDFDDSPEQGNRDNFVQNPAELREKAEQRRLSRRGAKGPPQRDVVGNPKGQGQEKDVVVSRDQKNTNKAARANHNRRVGSSWKRRQGMIPS